MKEKFVGFALNGKSIPKHSITLWSVCEHECSSLSKSIPTLQNTHPHTYTHMIPSVNYDILLVYNNTNCSMQSRLFRRNRKREREKFHSPKTTLTALYTTIHTFHFAPHPNYYRITYVPKIITFPRVVMVAGAERENDGTHTLAFSFCHNDDNIFLKCMQSASNFQNIFFW